MTATAQSDTAATTTPTYGEQLLTLERRGVDPVPPAERHGRPSSQLTLWLGGNLTIADFALGFLPVTLGLPWSWAIAAVLIGNVAGALAVACCSPMGPAFGLPQLVLGRTTFGRLGAGLPAACNYLSTLGWLTVNTILGAFGLRVLLPGLPFWAAALVLVCVQGLLAVYGHNLIHGFERVMAVVLGVVFLVVTVLALTHGARLAAYHPGHVAHWAAFAVMVAAAFSYVGAWAPYASDYSRYLREDSSGASVAAYSFVGSFVGSAWLELVGAMVAVLAIGRHGDAIAELHSTTTAGFAGVAVVAIVLGGIAANALNAYSNALSAGALGIRLPRWSLTVAACTIAFVAAMAGSGSFETNYEEFLLMLGYWITPWLGVLVADFYVLGRRPRPGGPGPMELVASAPAVSWAGVAAFVVGGLAAVPFMDGPLYEGPVARLLGGADLSYYVGFTVALALYLVAAATRARRSPAAFAARATAGGPATAIRARRTAP
ncbi:MAG: purine-cytosine permease family protein [Acidimicrobiales bacterium]